MKTLINFAVIATMFLQTGFLSGVPALAQGDGIRRGVHPQTGKLTFLGADPSNPIRVAKAMTIGLAPEARGGSILEMYAPEFGIRDTSRELRVERSTNADDRMAVKYQQVYNNIPVMAGELIVNMKGDGALLSINGEVSPELNLNTQPKLSAADARQQALVVVSQTYNLAVGELTVSEPELWIFDERLIQDNATQPAHLVWRMEVTSAKAPLRELVLVNAQSGKISLHFNQIDTAWNAQPLPTNNASDPRVISVVEPVNFLSDLESTPLGAPNPADIDRFVSTTGSDDSGSNTCAESTNPCATIQQAVDKAISGDIIAVAEGIYTFTGQLTPGVPKYIVSFSSYTKPMLSFYGGWNSDFTLQVGFSTIDGENKVAGISVYGKDPQNPPEVIVDHFYITNGSNGGISSSSNLIVSNSAIFKNVKSGTYANGGGVENTYGNLTLNNVTISNNKTMAEIGGYGGGVYSNGGTTNLKNVTITNNSSYDGGGIAASGTVSIKNTILYNNQASHQGPDCYMGAATSRNNIISDTTDCTMFSATNGNQLNVDPLLGMFIEAVGYQPLLSTSPAINHGVNCYGTMDQRGYVRVDACDIGAYEYPASIGAASQLVAASGDNQRAAPLTLFENPLAVAVLDTQGSPVAGQSVTFTAPSTGASGTFAGGSNTASASSGADGIVAFAFTANNQAGIYSVTADSSGLSSLSFNLKNIVWFVKPDGDDSSDCLSPATACATINAAINKLSAGENIFVAEGVYTSAGTSVVFVNKSTTIRGGWDSTFTTQNGYSTIDGENVRMGVYASTTGARMDRFIIQNGYAPAFGGGLNTDREFTLNDSIIRNNAASIDGGGIFNMGSLTLNRVLVHNNRSGSGGGIFSTGTLLVINNSGIFSNITEYGGGVYASNGKVKINNSTISQNTAIQHGGGVYNNYGTVTLNNATISDNHADYGGGIYNYSNGANSFTIKNTILARNTATSSGPNCGEEMTFGSVKSGGYNLISNTSGCDYVAGTGDLVNVNPVLGTFLPTRGYHPILAGSPAINAGSACYGTTDQRGVARVGACDMGAYEKDPVGAPTFVEIVDGDHQRTAPTFNFGKPFSVAVLDGNGSPVSGQSVTFSAPASGPSGAFVNGSNTDTPVTTNLGGIATSSAFTANTETGNYIVSATSTIGSADFHIANMVLYVDPGGSDSNDCLSVLTACSTLQGAIDKATENDVILVAAGIYTSSDDQVVYLSKSLTLAGGWESAFTTQTGYSTINGGGTSSGVIVPAGVTVSMKRFIVTNSWNNAIQKGGVYNEGTLTLSQCEVSHSASSYSGGGIYNAGTLILDDCVIRKNSTKSYGGGIYNSGNLIVENSVITGNNANLMSSGAQSYGGGVYNTGTANIHNSLIIENTGFLGAGIYSQSSLTLSRVSISQNTSANGGGLWVSGPATVLGSTIYGNTASGPGGGIYASAATLTLNNVTVSGNKASSGGGIYQSGTAGKITVKNTILGTNKITTGSGLECNGAIVSGGYNIVKSTSGCTITAVTGDQFGINPVLGVYLPSQGYQPLLSASPAINSANSANCLATDQRGASRVGVCDKGAYEYVAPGAPTQVVAPDWINFHVAPNSQLATPSQVVVLDAIGSPVGGVKVTFTAPSSGPSGLFTPTNNYIATVTTAESGIAAGPAYVANGELGSYVITASTNFDAASLNFTNLAWYVSNGGNNGNDCITPVTPCADVRGALEKADFLSGDVIWVASGTYNIAGINNFKIGKSASIVGGWDAAFTASTGASTFKDGFVVDSLYLDLNVQLSNLVIEDTTDGGATIWGIKNSETLVVKNTIIRNTATGIENYGNVTVINSTISGNDGYTFNGEGGIYNGYLGKPTNTVKVINSTITKNTGVGLANDAGAGAFTLVNSIVVGNINPYGPDFDCYGAFVSGGHNIFGNIGDPTLSSSCKGDWASTDQIGTKTKPIGISKVLVGTLTLDPLTGRWYHPLKLGSLAIDAGSTAPTGSGGNACPAFDQLGMARPQGVYCDIGAVEYQFNVHPPAALLKTYTAGNKQTLPGTVVCSGNDGVCAGGDSHARGAQANAYSTYQWYQTWHGRDSIDGNGLQIVSTVRYGSGYKDAYWNGHMLVYGDGYGFPLADDIVAHEYTHGVTQYESNLFPWYQSGAINESFSDLWGEAVDQRNGLGNDSSGVKWLIGEDVTGLGAIRNMKNPPAFDQPDSMSSALYCESGACLADDGGAHINSGVNNKAAYLMVAGGTFNGKTVTKLGLEKVLAIYYEAQTNLLTSGSDYLDLHNALYQACLNKVGVGGITNGNCQEVRDATLAVKMNQQPAANFNPDVADCPTGTYPVKPELFKEDFESGSDGWTFPLISNVSAWGLSGRNAASGSFSLWADDGYEKGGSYAFTRGIALPAGAKSYLHFTHAFGFEAASTAYYDGGVLEYSINNGKTWVDAKDLFSAGQDYKGTIRKGYGNPLEDRSAFVGDSHGYVDSRYNLSSLAGKTVRFRWRIGTDSAGSVRGWFVDDVRIYKCVAIPSRPALKTPANGATITDVTPFFNWSDSTPDLHHYELQIATNKTFTPNPLKYNNILASSFTPTIGLASGKTYYWRVRAFNAAGKSSPWSLVWSFTVPAP